MRKVPSQAYYQCEMMVMSLLAKNYQGTKKYQQNNTLQNILFLILPILSVYSMQYCVYYLLSIW